MGIPIPKVDSFSYLCKRRYLAHPFGTSTDLQCMYLSSPTAVGENFIYPFPAVAGVPCVDAGRASSMNFEVGIVGHFSM